MKQLKTAFEKTTNVLDRIHGQGFGWSCSIMLVMFAGSFFIPN